MNIKKIYSVIIVLMLTSTVAFGQSKDPVTIKFTVSGICGMCKERIENALDVKGVKYVNWEHSTHLCEVVYREDKISEKEIHQLINDAGHDTEKSKASDEAYDTVHGCCKYREHGDH